jgi:hypothetical protein
MNARANVVSAALDTCFGGELREGLAGQTFGMRQGLFEALSPHRFEHVTDCTRVKGINRVFIVGGRKDDGRRVFHCVEMVGGFDAVDTGHAYVEKHDFGQALRGERNRLLTIPRLANDLMRPEVVNQLPQAITCGLFVIDDQYFHAALSS